MVAYTLAEIAKHLKAQYQGDPALVISGVAALATAKAGQIAFLDNPKYRQYLKSTQASAVILSMSSLSDCPTNAIIVENPYYGYAQIAALFLPVQHFNAGIHPTAVIGERCEIHPTAFIGPYVVIGDDTHIAEQVIIESHTIIGRNCRIDRETHLFPRVTLYADVLLGKRIIIHSGAIIGSDGFGIAKYKGQWHKVPQLGRVRIGDDVEIGANTTVDRGALDDTVIEEGSKLDNQIQIAHNVKIGAHTAIAACTGIAGSTQIGRDCLIGGGVGINGHLHITDNVAITGTTAVTKSILDPGVYSSILPAMPNLQWKRNVARIRQLEKMHEQVQRLEAMMANLTHKKIEEEEP